MLEKVKVGDLAIFKNGEKRRIDCVCRNYNDVSICFDNPVSCETKNFNLSRWWAYKYNGEWLGDIDDRNDIVKVIHIEEG